MSHLPINSSDHKAFIIQLRDSPTIVSRRAKPWRFEAGCLQSPSVKRLFILTGGLQPRFVQVERCQRGGLPAQVEHCQLSLTSWSSRVFHRDKSRIQSLEKRLAFLLNSTLTLA
ncbi:UNVERIFIED_CONTAM: hypothetical protein Sangu_0479100 [Sesamum angustifolium]|uniref:Uncharacterized protein n=1 Tax=Sesamum angustifolium TaxID=2727405 RepID=A0AAW2Q7G8_9LAMI